jgi:hypothetical protein
MCPVSSGQVHFGRGGFQGGAGLLPLHLPIGAAGCHLAFADFFCKVRAMFRKGVAALDGTSVCMACSGFGVACLGLFGHRVDMLSTLWLFS